MSATSPRDVLDAAAVGQGSLYHHFGSKEALAGAAMREFAAELSAVHRATLGETSRSPRERIEAYLATPREAVRGCRLGRLAFDPAVVASPALRATLATYLADTVDALAAVLAEARANGELAADADVHALASAVAASVQGAYVLARASDDPRAMEVALNGLRALLLGALRPSEMRGAL